jgi:MFS-type transporter involved in bile tolerance (Atg22 family)
MNDVLNTLHKISSVLLVALGVVHTTLTPVFYGRFSLNALWFAGSGLAMVFLGFLNIALGRAAGRDRIVRTLCHVANLVTTVFGVLLATADSEPQVIFGLVLIFLMTVTAFMPGWPRA